VVNTLSQNSLLIYVACMVYLTHDLGPQLFVKMDYKTKYFIEGPVDI
jgi:hypothetical protein